MNSISEVITYLESVAPLHLQEDYDNSGLLLGRSDQIVKGVLYTLDVLESTVEEAIARSCNLIIAHHPIIFSGLKHITGKNYIERTVLSAIKHDIAIYACHTNLDNILDYGVNQKIAQKIGLTQQRILQPKDPSKTNIGSGLIGTLDREMNETAFLDHIKKTMNASCIRHTKLLGLPIRQVAICGGSGQFLLSQAIAQQADVFISSDFKYHQFFDADNRILIADIGHYESEQYTIELLNEIISTKFTTFASHCTKINTNPVKYY